MRVPFEIQRLYPPAPLLPFSPLYIFWLRRARGTEIGFSTVHEVRTAQAERYRT